MMSLKKIGIFLSVLLLTIIISAYGLFQISKSRTFQFFGGLINRVETEKKVVALTFDDAPTEYTEPVLQTLRDKKIKATFFVIGAELAKHPSIGTDIVQQGHEIGNHSYTHPRFYFKSLSFIDQEIQNTNALIRETGYTGEIMFRPPNGKKLIALPWYLSKHNMKTIMWDVEPDTYVPDGADDIKRDFIVSYTIEHSKPGSIILLHPFCKSCSADREAVGRIIEQLTAKGYRFVTVSELLSLKRE